MQRVFLLPKLIKTCVGILALSAGVVAYANSGVDSSLSKDSSANSSTVSSTVTDLSSQDFIQLMQQTQQAALQGNYEGVFVSQWVDENTFSSHILNFMIGQDQYRKVEALDGDPVVWWRTNQVQLQIIPSHKQVVYTQTRDYDFPGIFMLGHDSLNHIVKYYKAQIHSQPTRVAGLACQLVDIVPLTHDRYGFKLCVDPQTHLLLMVESLGNHHHVIGRTAFTSVVSVKGSPTLLEHAKPILDKSYQWYKYERKNIPVTYDGWQFTFPQGFDVVLSSLMPLNHQKSIHQITLSDGLSSLSVFIQAIAPDKTVAEGNSVQGTLNVYSRRQGNFLITAVGTMPLKTLQSVVHSAQQVSQ